MRDFCTIRSVEMTRFFLRQKLTSPQLRIEEDVLSPFKKFCERLGMYH